MECFSAQKPTQKGSLLQQIPQQDSDARDPTTATATDIQPELAEKEVTTPINTTYTNLNNHRWVTPESNQQFRRPLPFPQTFQKQK